MLDKTIKYSTLSMQLIFRRKKMKKTKEKFPTVFMGGRIPARLFDEYTEYSDFTGIKKGKLITNAITEYLLNHPVSMPKPVTEKKITKEW